MQRGFSADPEHPPPPPPPSWHSWAKEGEGEGREPERGAVGPHTRALSLHSHPSCPRGSQTPRGAGKFFPRRGGTKGWEDEWGPTGIERCQAGGQRAGSSECRRLLRAAGRDRLDARPSVPLSIQGGSSLGGSEAGRALLKSFLCVCVLIT